MKVSSSTYSNYTHQPLRKTNTTPTNTQSIIPENTSLKTDKAQQQTSLPLLSHTTHTTLLNTQETEPSKTSYQTVSLNTTKGQADINLDEYFYSDTQKSTVNLQDIPLLLPTANNIQSLQAHASERFSNLLAQYNIPSAPDEITYDNAGNMQLPADYPYAEELKQALSEEPNLERELRTINALTSHYVEMQKSLPFHEEYSHATSQIEAEAIIHKYRDLFNDNRNYSSISLSFSQQGQLEVLANHKAVHFT